MCIYVGAKYGLFSWPDALSTSKVVLQWESEKTAFGKNLCHHDAPAPS